MSAIAAADALMADQSTPQDMATLASEAAKSPSEKAHPELLSSPTPEAQAAAEAEKERGNALFAACKFNLAREAYTKAIDLSPRVPAYWSNRAFCELKLEEYGSALLDADKAIELDRSFIKAYYRRGAAHMALGKMKEARLDFKTVVKLKPSDKDAQSKLKECEKTIYAAAFAAAIEGEKRPPASQTAKESVKDMQVESGYSGPRYTPGAIDLSFVRGLMDLYKSQKRLPRKYIYEILMDIIPLLRSLPTLVDIDIPAGAKFTVCGDVHGQFWDVCNIFQLNGMPSEENPFLFNGDFVDRGSFSIEVIMLFFSFKLLYPRHFHMTRGNHETLNMNTVYGFQGEVNAKVDAACFELFSEAFNLLPLAACLQKKVLCVHGGLFSDDDVTLDMIRAIDRNQQPPESGLMSELLWSDPQKQMGRAPSKRGVGQWRAHTNKRLCASLPSPLYSLSCSCCALSSNSPLLLLLLRPFCSVRVSLPLRSVFRSRCDLQFPQEEQLGAHHSIA